MVSFSLSVSSHTPNFVYQDMFYKMIGDLAGVGFFIIHRNHLYVFLCSLEDMTPGPLYFPQKVRWKLVNLSQIF